MCFPFSLSNHQSSKLPIDEDDVGLIYEDLYRGRSALPPHDVPVKPTLVRWDYTKPLTLDNCIVLDFKDAEKHVKACQESGSPTAALDLWGPEVEAIVQRRSAEARKCRDWVM